MRFLDILNDNVVRFVMNDIAIMECSHWPTQTQTPIKNGFIYNMQNCLDWPTQTQTPIKNGFIYNMQNCLDWPTQTQMQMGCKPILSVSVSVSVSASVNTP